MSPNPREGEAAGTREAVTTPCLAGGIGLPRLHEAREALPPFSPFLCLRLGGSSSARLGKYAVVAQSVEQPGRACAGSIPASGNTLHQKRRMDAGKNGAQIAGWKRAGLQARPIKTHPSVSSSRDGRPYLSRRTTVDGAHSIAFLRPNIQPRRG